MNSFDHSQRQDSLKRRWQERRFPITMTNNASRFVAGGAAATVLPAAAGNNATPVPPPSSAPFVANPNNNNKVLIQSFPGLDHDEDLVSSVVPPAVTVVLEGRSICHRISLHKHAGYHSLAKALRQMFVDDIGGGAAGVTSENDLDLSNAVPGHLIAYEDMENDLLLAGDLNWKDFVRVAKRIRILPAKRNSSRKGRGTPVVN